MVPKEPANDANVDSEPGASSSAKATGGAHGVVGVKRAVASSAVTKRPSVANDVTPVVVGGDESRRHLLELAADMLATAHDDALQRFDVPVLLLIDNEDSLGQAICEQYQLEGELQVMPLERDEALALLSGRADSAAEQLLLAEGDVMRVIVIAHEGATVCTIPL